MTLRHASSNATAAILGIAACILVSTVACRPASDREQLRKQVIQRLRERIDQERVTDARFRRLPTGTPSAEVVKQFGKPGMTAPCSNGKTCWYYDISGQKYFVCFDQQGTVACQGKAYVFR